MLAPGRFVLVSRLWPIPWLIVLSPALSWTGRTLIRPEYRPNCLILLAVFALVVRGYLKGHRLGPLSARVGPLVLSLGSLAVYLWAERSIDISIVSATAAFCCLYGLLGLFISPGRWRRARAGLLLALAALPFAEQAHHYAGFALRLLTAELVASQLASLGLETVAAQTILVLENGVTHIEAACSGLRSVWAGSLLLLGFCYAKAYPVGRALVLAFLVQSTLLLLGNAIRITALVVLVHHYQWPWVAELVHQPLGILAFCAAGWAGAQTLVVASKRTISRCRTGRLVMRKATLSIFLGLIGMVALAMYQPRTLRTIPATPVKFRLPESISTTPLKLTPTESKLFELHGAQARKLKLKTPTLDGSIILVAAVDWRVHHPPALCLAGAGHRLDAPQRHQFGPFVKAIYSTTNQGERTAVHWFQSRTRTTPELLDRIQDGVFGQQETWVLVSLLINQPLSPQSPELETLIDDIQHAVAAALEVQP